MERNRKATKNIGLLIVALGLFIPNLLSGQYLLFNSATKTGKDTYRLTPDSEFTVGSVWNGFDESVESNFEVSGKMFFGNRDNGADGIVFVMQTNCVSGGRVGSGIGYANIPGPSLGIEFDTYENNSDTASGDFDNNDPVFDHIGIQKNGVVNHKSPQNILLSPIQMHASKSNVEDGIWYNFRIVWNASSKTISVFFDNTLRATLPIDLKKDVFNNSDVFYWGFTSATGGSFAPNSVQIDERDLFFLPNSLLCKGDSLKLTLPIVTNADKISALKPIKVSSTEEPYFSYLVNDADVTTRWASLTTDNQSLVMDLQNIYQVSKVRILWETAAAREYRIEVSTDNINWTTVSTITNGLSGEDRTINFSAINARYVKMQGVSRTTIYGYSIFEFEVFGKGEYKWSPTTNILGASTSTPILFPSTTTLYNVTIPERCSGPIPVEFTVEVVDLKANIITPTKICVSDTVILKVNTTGAKGKTTNRWIPSNSTQAVFKLFPAVANTYEVIVTDSIGCKDTASVAIALDQLPDKAMVTNDVLSVCANSASITANAPLVGVGVWDVILPNQSTIVNRNSRSTTVNNLPENTSKLKWTVTNGVCPPSLDTLTINRSLALAIPEAGENKNVCLDKVSLNATTPLVGTGIWTIKRGFGIFINPRDPKTEVTGLSRGVNEFYWTVSNGVCTSLKDSVTITSEAIPAGEMPKLNIANDTICLGSAALITQSSAGTNLKWFSSTDKINFLPIVSVQNFISVTPSVLTYYTTRLDITSCTNLASDTISIFPNPKPVGGILSPLSSTICEGSSATLSLTGQRGTVKWQSSANSTDWTDEILVNNPLTFEPTANITYRAIVSDKFCPSDFSNSASISIDKKPSVALTVKDDKGICSDTKGIEAILPAVGVGSWKVISGTANILNANLAVTSVNGLLPNKTVILEWAVKNGVCPESKDQLKIDRVPSLSEAIAKGVETCNDFSELSANSPLVGETGLWTQSGNAVIVNKTSPTTNVEKLLEGENSFTWTISNGGLCAPNSTTVVINVDPKKCIQRPPFKVYEAVTPNGDNKNDYIHIQNIELYPNTDVKIFNRWGSLIWELPTTCDGYQNNVSACSFSGKSNIGVGSGGDVADGSYYYVVDGTKDGSIKTQGYLVKN